MSVLSSIGIVVLAMLIMGSLQLVPGVFALFYHYSSGRFSRRKASTLSLFFILGAEIISAFLFIASFYISYLLFLQNLNPHNNILTWIVIGIFIALAVISLLFYYRRPHSKDTELFIPRKFAKNLNLLARKVKTPSDAFTLGALSNVYELVFTLPLYIVTATEIMYMHTEYIADDLLTILYILTTVIPLFSIYFSYTILHHNLAHIERARVKDKAFHRIFISICYLTIAILLIYFRITNL